MITSLSEAIDYLYNSVPSIHAIQFPGEVGLERTKYLMELLGNPQNKIKVIHVVGTSGKGSTAYLLSLLLKKAGFSVGLHIKPHVKDFRERFQINNQLLSEAEVCKYLNTIIPAIDKVKTTDLGAPTYFEILVALAFYMFADKKVDYAVVEAGVGGLLDGTNTVTREDKIVVITKIGLDHMHILGNTVKEIAFQKASVIHNKNMVISIDQDIEAKKEIDTIAKSAHADVHYVHFSTEKSRVSLDENRVIFDFALGTMELRNIALSMPGIYQAENATVALTTAFLLAKRDGFILSDVHIRESFSHAHYPGRMDVFLKDNKHIIVDGAHNQQKMHAFLLSLKELYPNKKFDFLLAFKKGKDIYHMLDQIIPLARHVTVTAFHVENQDWVHIAEDPQKIAQYLEQHGCHVTVEAQMEHAYTHAFVETKEILVVTGSLYLISDLYHSSSILNNT